MQSAQSARALTAAEQEAMAQKDEAILLLLAKLALNYWRPDFTAGQAKQLYLQYLDDLRDHAFADIKEAIDKYRQNPENKFFPTSGQLRGLIINPPSWWVNGTKEFRNERHAVAKAEFKRISSDPRLQITDEGNE